MPRMPDASRAGLGTAPDTAVLEAYVPLAQTVRSANLSELATSTRGWDEAPYNTFSAGDWGIEYEYWTVNSALERARQILEASETNQDLSQAAQDKVKAIIVDTITLIGNIEAARQAAAIAAVERRRQADAEAQRDEAMAKLASWS